MQKPFRICGKNGVFFANRWNAGPATAECVPPRSSRKGQPRKCLKMPLHPGHPSNVPGAAAAQRRYNRSSESALVVHTAQFPPKKPKITGTSYGFRLIRRRCYGAFHSWRDNCHRSEGAAPMPWTGVVISYHRHHYQPADGSRHLVHWLQSTRRHSRSSSCQRRARS